MTTAKATHTPGPLMVDGVERLSDVARGLPPDRQCVKIYTKTGFHIGYWVPLEWDGLCPDATLFAAAPELLEACERVLRSLEWSTTDERLDSAEQAAILRAAIAKATT